MADPVIRNALADIIYEELACKEYIDMADCIGAAAEVLASRWITESVAKARADALEEAAVKLEAEAKEYESQFGIGGLGGRDAAVFAQAASIVREIR